MKYVLEYYENMGSEYFPHRYLFKERTEAINAAINVCKSGFDFVYVYVFVGRKKKPSEVYEIYWSNLEAEPRIKRF